MKKVLERDGEEGNGDRGKAMDRGSERERG